MVFKQFKDLRVNDEAVCFVNDENGLDAVLGKIVELDDSDIAFCSKNGTLLTFSKEEVGYTFFVLDNTEIHYNSYRGVPIILESDGHFSVDILGRKYQSRRIKDLQLLIDDVLAIVRVHQKNT